VLQTSVYFFYQGDGMKKLLALALLLASLGQCGAIELIVISSENYGDLDAYKEEIYEYSDKKSLPSDPEKAQEAQLKVWGEVAAGKRNLVIACDDDRQYMGHLYFSQDDARIRLAVQGFKDPAQQGFILANFIKKLQLLGHDENSRIGNELYFAFPPSLITPEFQVFINAFKFVQSSEPMSDEHREKCRDYGFPENLIQELVWFIRPGDAVIPAV